MALQELADLAISKTPSPLSLSKLRQILNTYGPNLHINQRSSIGSTFLVDVLRARHVKENVILNCVKELVLVYNASLFVSALVDNKKKSSSSRSSSSNSGRDGNELPPLVIAAARGMSSIVKFMLSTVSSNSINIDNDNQQQQQQLQQQHQHLALSKERLLQMKGTSRFRLFKNAKKSIHGTFTPLEFVLQMKEAEILHGASKGELKSLNECIKLLSPS